MNLLDLCDNETQATNLAIDWLHRRGYSITKPTGLVEKYTAKELREKFAPHLSAAGFHQRLHHPDCPLYASDTGDGGRTVRITPTPALIRFLGLPKKQGKWMGWRAA